jgi:hypothetical protein
MLLVKELFAELGKWNLSPVSPALVRLEYPALEGFPYSIGYIFPIHCSSRKSCNLFTCENYYLTPELNMRIRILTNASAKARLRMIQLLLSRLDRWAPTCAPITTPMARETA